MTLEELLPAQFGEWTSKKTVSLKSDSDLYNYMDGGAELYLSYSFKEGLSRTFSRDDSLEVVAELYDMNNSQDAFGVFTQFREDENTEYGQGSYIIPGSVNFWKDHYFVSLSSWNVSAECNEFLELVAAHIDKNITEKGDLPGILKLLPEEGLTKAGFKYFYHPVWINSYYFITDQNIFYIDQSVEAVIAKYEDSQDNKKYLLLVQYDDVKKAGLAFDSFRENFFRAGLNGDTIRLEDGKWLAASYQGRLIISVFNAITRESALQLLENVNKSAKNINL